MLSIYDVETLRILASGPLTFPDVFSGEPFDRERAASCERLHKEGLAFASFPPLGRPQVVHITFEGRKELAGLATPGDADPKMAPSDVCKPDPEDAARRDRILGGIPRTKWPPK